ncbi:hypothetical protein ABIB26_004342 [Arthrobacter sp. UYEF20]
MFSRVEEVELEVDVLAFENGVRDDGDLAVIPFR